MKSVAVCLFVCLAACVAASAEDVVLSGSGYVRTSALSQPILNAVLTDENGAVVVDGNGDPVLFNAYIDTGASGIVISKMTAQGDTDYGVIGLGLDPADSLGDYTEVGIGGQEVGWISPGYGLRIANGEGLTSTGLLDMDDVFGDLGLGGTGSTGGTTVDLSNYQTFQGLHGLWVRKEIGLGEIIMSQADPVNIIGMPIIRQKAMVIDTTPVSDYIAVFSTALPALLGGTGDLDDIFALTDLDLNATGQVRTYLVDPGSSQIPETNISLHMYLKDFTGDAPLELSHSENPMVSNVTTVVQGTSVTSDWLFDTGAGSSFISFTQAQELGLIGEEFADVADYLASNPGVATSAVGGIGDSMQTVPILTLDEIRIPDQSGNFDVVWNDVEVLVLDVAGLDGVFGMNLLTPSITIDLDESVLDLLNEDDDLFNYSDLLNDLGLTALALPASTGDPLGDLLLAFADASYLDLGQVVFDATDPNNVQLLMYSSAVPEPASAALLSMGAVSLLTLRRRRRKA